MHKIFHLAQKVFFVLPIYCLILSLDIFSFAEEIKKPNVSGAFYPCDAQTLSVQIDNFLNKANVEEVKAEIFALISPHAGYIYSGPVAAFGYKAIKSRNYKTVIILGPSHFFGFNGISVWPQGSFRTPLGDVLVDEKFTKELIAQIQKARFIPEAFAKEHSLEVQIPFLQKVLGNFSAIEGGGVTTHCGWKIVPIVMGRLNLQDCKRLASVLKKIIAGRRDVLVVASTDLSHYHPYSEAIDIDKRTLSYIENFDFDGLWREALIGNAELCGLRSVITTLILAKEQNINGVKVLKYANSGDTAGGKGKVVGYASVIIYNEENREENMLNKEEREKLLKIARDSFENYITNGERLNFTVDDSALTKVQGAFVTLNEKGQLRGCIGRIIADKPLFQVVADMAIEAATGDPRFPPVTKKELSDIEVEISVLSPFEKIDDVSKIEVGKHGIMMRRGFNSGLLLPQVATEYGWDRDTFLGHTCYKAGLPTDAWKDKATEIYIFSAEVFSEKDH